MGWPPQVSSAHHQTLAIAGGKAQPQRGQGERGVPEERQLASLLREGRAVVWRGSGLTNQLPPKPAPGQGLEFHKKAKRAL